MEPVVRKIHLVTELVLHDGGPVLAEPVKRGAISAVVANPYAGTYQPDLTAWMESLSGLGLILASELRDTLIGGGDGRRIEGYGKGAIVGVNGELEMTAVWHGPGGAGLRAALADPDGAQPKAMVPSTTKVGNLGCQIDIPMVYLHASYLRSHYDVIPVVVPDAPRPDEVVYTLVMTTGQRPHHRIGGFTMAEVVGDDGLR